MKKILAMILVLCMAAAAVPALAEGEITGTWYMLVVGLTTATFDLNEDGTCSMEANNDGEEIKAEGTWTMEGEAVTVTLKNGEGQEQQVPLTYDGETLSMSMESIAAIKVAS